MKAPFSHASFHRRLAKLATGVIGCLKTHAVAEEIHGGRAVVVKTHNLLGAQIAKAANAYFKLAGISLRYCTNAADWQRWEVESFLMLNGDRFQIAHVGAKAVREDKLPGTSLWVHLTRRTLTAPMLRAAARELRRAHGLWSAQFGGPWSHGDASMPNVLYDASSRRARLIDFELTHAPSLPPVTRHADDLLIFLLDLISVAQESKWLPFAVCFVTEYGDAAVIAELRRLMAVPEGLACIWWKVRTNFAEPAKLRRRLAAVRKAIGGLGLHRAAAPRPPKRRRPSNTCHTTSAGMPTASSRARSTRDRARAVSPGMPRKLPTMT